jgi:hypothetical protein
MYLLDRWRYRATSARDRPAGLFSAEATAQVLGASLTPFVEAIDAVLKEYYERQPPKEAIDQTPGPQAGALPPPAPGGGT